MRGHGSDMQILIEMCFKIDTDVHSPKYVEEMKRAYTNLYGWDYANNVAVSEFGSFDGAMHALGDAAKYMARLSFYAHGDNRSSGIIESLSFDSYSVAATSTMPKLFCVQYSKHGNIAIPNTSFAVADNDTLSASVSDSPTASQCPLNAGSAVNLACMKLFQACASIIAPPVPYSLNESGEWGYSDTINCLVKVQDAIIDGKVNACPQCGRPVFMARKNAKPFCNTGHYNRYNEAARQMLKNGTSVDVVHASFPEISRATIETWPKS